MLEKALYKVSVIIKAFNEEAKIAKSIKSALNEVQEFDGEVIVVDSLSTDNTINIARQFLVKIVQFVNQEDCNCGAAVQLGYQYARGDFIYVLDGDMELAPGFLTMALEQLLNDPSLAGVGGIVKETQVLTMYDRIRATQLYNFTENLYVNELGGGGLYRSAAIKSVGYLGHQGLRAYEEADLGFRLTAAGWKLLRLPHPAVFHTGHNENTFEMFIRLLRNKRAYVGGVLIKAALGQPWFKLTLKKQWYIFILPAICTFALITSNLISLVNNKFSSLSGFLAIYLALWGIILVMMSLRKHSFKQGIFSVISWHYFSIAAIIGMLQKKIDPYQQIDSKEILVSSTDTQRAN
ncbi:MAG: glycosyltransferase [Pseudomonadota bacterium]